MTKCMDFKLNTFGVELQDVASHHLAQLGFN